MINRFDKLNKKNDVNSIENSESYNNVFTHRPISARHALDLDQSAFVMQDFLFIPKLIGLSQDVYTMINKGVSSTEVNSYVKSRFLNIQDNPKVSINVNVAVLDASGKKPPYKIVSSENFQFLSNFEKCPLNGNAKPQLEPIIEPHFFGNKVAKRANNMPTPIKSLDNQKANYNSSILKNGFQTFQTYQSTKIKKRMHCGCTKKRSLEDLMREERLFNKQAEKVKYFWRSTNINYPFTFKKKMIDYYSETNEAMISEVVDFSKKTINADDLHESL